MITYIIIIILILLIGYLFITRVNIFDRLVNGFYEADASFCQEADLDAFCLYIDDETTGSGSRSCYILAKKGADIIINEPCSVKLNLTWGNAYNAHEKHFTAEFIGLSADCAEVFPKKQQLKFYPQIGKIVLYDHDTITYCGYKNALNTEMKSVVNDRGKGYNYDSDSE